MNPVIEVCVESYEEALKAVNAGATRIELCENLAVGGTTPSYGTIKLCLEKIAVPVMVMIRPRGGNFCYSQDEFEIMKEDILLCKRLSVKGVVFGILTQRRAIDEERTKELVILAKPMEVTFHKAIDQVEDILKGVAYLNGIGVNRILSSGGKETAMQGENILNHMIRMASPKLTIIVAGKVTYENFGEVQKRIPTNEYHGRRLVLF